MRCMVARKEPNARVARRVDSLQGQWTRSKLGVRALTVAEVRWARERWQTPNLDERLSQRQLAAALDVSIETVQRVLKHLTYRDVR